MKALGRLWRGEIPLDEAFWTWVVLVGITVNLLTSFLFLICITLDQTVLALLAGYGLSVPYNIVALVGVWRSAERAGSSKGDIFRMAAIILMVLLTVT